MDRGVNDGSGKKLDKALIILIVVCLLALVFAGTCGFIYYKNNASGDGKTFLSSIGGKEKAEQESVAVIEKDVDESAITMTRPVMSDVSDVSASDDYGLIFTWKKVPEASGYEYYYENDWEDESYESEIVRTSDTTAIDDVEGASCDVSFYVRAYKESDGKTEYSDWEKKEISEEECEKLVGTGDSGTAAKAKTPRGSNEAWKKAYIDYVKEHGNKKDYFGDPSYHYQLVDINDDDIPELYCNFGCTAEGDAICTYYNGKIVEQHMWNYGVSYMEGENLFCDTGGHMDTYYDKVYTIKNGEFVLIADGEYGKMDDSNVQVDDDGSPIYEYKYYWNNKLLSSEEEYQKSLKAVYDIDKADTPFDESGYGMYDYEEIIQIINAY